MTISRIEMFLFFFLAIICLSSAFPTYLCANCQNTDLDTANSTYQSNLKLLLSSLYSKAKDGAGFFNTSYRSFPDTVYGSFLCRGDVTADVCLECMETATKEIRIRCPIQKGAITWYDECQLHYSSKSCFSVDADRPMHMLRNDENVSNPDQFSKLLNEAMRSLVSQVAFSPSSNMFAVKEVNSTAYPTLFLLGQCTLDLSDSTCYSCLLKSVDHLLFLCAQNNGGRILQPSCNVRYEQYLFYRRSAIASAPPAIPKPTFNTTVEGNHRLWISTIIAIVVPIALAVLVILSLCYIFLKRKAPKKKNHVGNGSQLVGSLQFDLDTIRAATCNFSDTKKIGEGGYCTVYKGILSNGEEIAVKRLSRDSGEIAEALKKEVLFMAKLQHRNLQRLLGFCSEGGERMFIYEFVSSDGLDTLLFDTENRAQLDWPMRLKIIAGVARGLLYLHDDAPLRIIHCDIKVSIVHLDGNMNAKISNFGMARSWADDQTIVNPHRDAETYSHLAPECVLHGQFSAQSDVYSFGVLLLEIISSKRNECSDQPDHAENLLNTAWRFWNEGQAMELLNPTLRLRCQNTEVMKYIQIGLLCVQEDAADRPSMASVVLMLNSDPSSLPIPRSQPPSALHRAEVASVNEIAISELSPR